MVLKILLAAASLMCFAPKDVPQDTFEQMCGMMPHDNLSLTLVETYGKVTATEKFRCNDENKWLPVSVTTVQR